MPDVAMKRTFTARHVGVGSIEPGPDVVDKGANWGSAYTRVQEELQGVLPTVECVPCGVLLSVEPGMSSTRYLLAHQRGKRHRALTGE